MKKVRIRWLGPGVLIEQGPVRVVPPGEESELEQPRAELLVEKGLATFDLRERFKPLVDPDFTPMGRAELARVQRDVERVYGLAEAAAELRMLFPHNERNLVVGPVELEA